MGSVAQRSSAQLLDLVFGNDSVGRNPEERATSSKRMFVKSQVQIAPASPDAKGRVLSAHEALQTFGWATLLQVANEGFAPLVGSASEPAETLKTQRTNLGLTVDEVSRRTGLSSTDIEKAERPGSLTSIRILENLGQTLALDERRLGYKPNAGRDSALGIRLRELKQAVDVNIFGANTVLELSEAAWVISRQAYLSKTLGFRSPRKIELPARDADYSQPAFRVGYMLAERTRGLLHLNDEQPIESLRILIEEVLDLPLIQQVLDVRFAGATIANGNIRGIVINEKGMNSNVWVRRMTLCHEVGHLLWDPDTHLEQLKVDEYSEVDRNDVDQRRDPVEVRANAFAAAFLAPPQGVSRIAKECRGNAWEIVSRVMTTYGISAIAAKHHVHNITYIDTSEVHASSLPMPTDDWIAQEDLSIAYFPIAATPISRRGKFAWFVAKLFASGMLSQDTVAFYLKCDQSEINLHLKTILDMWPNESASPLG